MKKKHINIVQNIDRVDLLTSCKMTRNFGASVTFALKFRHCVEAIFLVFRVCWEARGMACGPCFLFLRCTGFCLYFLHFIYVKPVRSPLIQRTPAGSSFRLLAQTFYTCFLAQNNVRHLVIRIRFGDLRHEQLGTCFFPVLRHNLVLFLKRSMADVVEKGQSFNGVGKSLFAVYLENTLFKEKFIHPF